MQTEKKLFPISPTVNRAGIFMTPDSFLTAAQKSIPLIIFFHGIGEASKTDRVDVSLVGDAAGLTGLYTNGSPLAQGVAGRLNAVVCPVTGKTYTPAIFALQGISQPNGTYPWCVNAVDMVYAIRQLLKDHPQLDDSGMLVTGLSAGGAETWRTVYGPDWQLFAAGVPLSTPGIDATGVSWPRNGKAWAFHGTGDTGSLTNIQNSVWCVAQANAGNAGAAALQPLPGGHDVSVWGFVYNPLNRFPINYTWGNMASIKQVNMYEWWLACKNSGFSFTGAIPAPVVAHSTTKANATVTVSPLNNVTLDASGSTGNIGSYDWYITGPNGYVSLSAEGVANPGGKIVVVPLKAGTYNVRLRVYDTVGGNDEVNYPFTVGVAPAGPTIVASFVVNGVTHNAYSDGTWK